MIRSWLRNTSKRTVGIVVVIFCLVLIAVPAAILNGALSFLFDSPEEGLLSFVVVLGLGLAMLVGELAIDTVREKIAERRRGRSR